MLGLGWVLNVWRWRWRWNLALAAASGCHLLLNLEIARF